MLRMKQASKLPYPICERNKPWNQGPHQSRLFSGSVLPQDSRHPTTRQLQTLTTKINVSALRMSLTVISSRRDNAGPFLLRAGLLNLQSCPLSTRHVTQQPRQHPSLDDITEDDRRRVYIQSAGNRGVFFACCLAAAPNPPPIALIVHEERRLEQF